MNREEAKILIGLMEEAFIKPSQFGIKPYYVFVKTTSEGGVVTYPNEAMAKIASCHRDESEDVTLTVNSTSFVTAGIDRFTINPKLRSVTGSVDGSSHIFQWTLVSPTAQNYDAFIRADMALRGIQ